MKEYTLWIVTDQEGNIEADADREIAIERFSENVGTDCYTSVREMKIRIPDPKPVVVTFKPEADASVSETEEAR